MGKRGSFKWMMVAALLAMVLPAGLASAQMPIVVSGLPRGTLYLGSTPTVRAWGMGGASIAVEGAQSANPAALGWVDGYEIEGTYGHLGFGQGPDANYGRLDVVTPVPYVGGALKLKTYLIESNKACSDLGELNTYWWGREAGFAYGRAVCDWLSFGVGGYPYDRTQISLVDPATDLRVAKGTGTSFLGSVELGALLRPSDKFNIGVIYAHRIDHWRINNYALGKRRSKYYMNKLELGAAIKPDDKTIIAGEYRIGHISGKDVDPDAQRWGSVGIERYVTDWLALRAGIHHESLTLGGGVEIPGGWEVNYAYVDGAHEGVDKVFGHATLHTISVTKRF